MKGKKLFQLLACLTNEEFKLLAKAIKSPLWNTNDRLILVYRQLKPFYPAFEVKEKNYHQIYRVLFKEAAYNDYKLRRLFSELTKITERFLIHLELEKAPQSNDQFLVQALGRRNVYHYFEKETLTLLDQLKEVPFKDMEHYQTLISLHYDLYFHPLTNRHSINDDHLAALMNNIDSYYILAKLRVGSEWKNREKMLNTRYEIQLEKAILGTFGEQLEGQNPIYRMYKLVYQLFQQEESEMVFHQLKDLFIPQIRKLRQIDQFFILHHLINFSARQINNGKAGFYKEALDLYKIGLTQELLLENGKMREASFSNIILLGCQEKAFEWTEHFISIYAQYLDEEIREDAKIHALGLWHFYKKDYSKSTEQLLHHKFSPAYQPRVRIIIIRSLFEQFIKDHSIYSLLQAQLDAFEKYISRNEFMNKSRLEPHINTTRIIRKFAQLLFEHEPKKGIKEWLEQELASEKKIIGKPWLEDKVKQLLKSGVQ
ncbi:MAG: hypothetical protein R2828_20815 [Saprospiraceae bacterium]